MNAALPCVTALPLTGCMVIDDYQFGPDGDICIDLRCYWTRLRPGTRAFIQRIECDNSRTREPLWEPCRLPDAVIDALEREVTAELRDRELVDDEEIDRLSVNSTWSHQ